MTFPLHRAPRSRRKSWTSALFLLAGVPLIVFHAGLLVERALHLETLDTLIAVRWVLSIALLVVVGLASSRLRTLDTRTLVITLALIVALVHAPVAVPEPTLPLAAAGLGLALSVALLDRRRDRLDPDDRSGQVSHPARMSAPTDVALEALKDRAPPGRL